MNIAVFNLSLLAAWVLVSAGAWLFSPAIGLITAGCALVALTVLAARIGGLYKPGSGA